MARTSVSIVTGLFLLTSLSSHFRQSAAQQQATSAWKDGRLQVNVPHVIGRSDLVLGRPNTSPEEALPLGNGTLGVAVWAEHGLTAQLNRADTMPYRYSTGQVNLPELAALTSARDYAGRLDLYNGAFVAHGAGTSVSVYVQPHSDTLVFDITGADPSKPQIAILKLWAPRKPHASTFANSGMLAETWKDDINPGASGRVFGSLSAITADGRNVSVAVTDERTVTLTATPYADGHLRVFVASPHYAGAPEAATHALVASTLADRDPAQHVAWWHALWQRASIIKVTSADGSGEYLENLRNLYLFGATAEGKGDYPGSQAGVGDLFSAFGDQHMWDPSAFWHWNLRMMVGANLGAGLPELNLPYFSLYRENLANIEAWTKTHMSGAPGICVPETMRFNGQGIEHELWVNDGKGVSGWNCDAASVPYYNARTLSTGAEVSLWIWQQYLQTGDLDFLRANYPVMVAAAHFLTSYEKPGSDGLLHTAPSNAHETQWDVTDPTTDLAARQALYPALIEAATLLHRDPALVTQLRAELTRIPTLPRTLPVPTAPPNAAPQSAKVLLTPADDAQRTDVFANSYKPTAPNHNVENIGLEPVWPYNVISDASPLFDLARRTYRDRPNKDNIDWSCDPIDAARLGLGDEMARSLVTITEHNQLYVNGFAKWGGTIKEFYIEQTGVVALALQEALAQDYDGTIRIAPAAPSTWEMEGTVAVRKQTVVDVQVNHGTVTTVGLAVKLSQPIKVKNPWPGRQVQVIDVGSRVVVVKPTLDDLLHFAAAAGHTYRIEPLGNETPLSFAAIDGTPATSARKLGPVELGLYPAAISSTVPPKRNDRKATK